MVINPETKISPALIVVIIIAIILLIISPSFFFYTAIAAFIIWNYIRKKDESLLSLVINKFKNMSNPLNVDPEAMSRGAGKAKKIMTTIILVLVAIWIFSRFIVIVGAGETGVYTLFGKVRDQELKSGFHLVNPLASVTKMSVRTEEYTMSIAPNEGVKKGDDAIAALTKEGLDVKLDITVLYRLNDESASDIYRTVGLTYVDKIIRPEVRTVIREVVAQYEAKELYSDKREVAAGHIMSLLEERIEPRGIVIENSLLRNVQLPPNLTKSIQEKLSAEQEAQKYDFVLDRERKEADRKRIEAEGQRDAQKTISESLTDQYLNYLYIQGLKDRQGTIYVPISPSTGMPMFKGIQ